MFFDHTNSLIHCQPAPLLLLANPFAWGCTHCRSNLSLLNRFCWSVHRGHHSDSLLLLELHSYYCRVVIEGRILRSSIYGVTPWDLFNNGIGSILHSNATSDFVSLHANSSRAYVGQPRLAQSNPIGIDRNSFLSILLTQTHCANFLSQLGIEHVYVVL